MRRLNPLPPIRIVSADQATAIPSFRDWMATCLYDPTAGFYASGRVEIGDGGDFQTFPQRLRPRFAEMVWDTASHLLAPQLQSTMDEPIWLVEFGGGRGELAVDLMRHALARASEGDEIARRMRYRLVEPSAAMRDAQREALAELMAEGRVEVVDGSIVDFDAGAFCGVTIANEVFDALPCEQLHITPREIFRTHVAVFRDGDASPLTVHELGGWLAQRGRFHVEEWHVPLGSGWATRDGVGEAPVALRRHVACLAPLIDDSRSAGMVPCDYYWSPDSTSALTSMVRHLDEGAGGAIVIDYGGTARYALDRSLVPHLRVYSRDEPRRTEDPYARPGDVDLTWDIDFTELASHADSMGLSSFYGHQAIIEPRERTHDVGAADADLLRRFRHDRGFRALLIAPDDTPFDSDRFGEPDDALGPGLRTISPHATFSQLRDALSSTPVPPDVAVALGFGCDVVGTLADLGHYEARWQVLESLSQRRLLTDPPEIRPDHASSP